MKKTVVRIGLALLAAVAVAISAAPVASAEPGPAYRDSEQKMAAALSCEGMTGAAKAPVLLLPAIGMSPDANFGWGFKPALRARGHGTCSLTFPGNGGADVQLSAEYVTFAVRKMYAESGSRKVSMIGHSLGGVPGVWATQFWPDLAQKVDDVISMGAPLNGTNTFATVCKLEICGASARQLSVGSNFVNKLQSTPLPAGPSYTSLWTPVDEWVIPSEVGTALPTLGNAQQAHFRVQEACGGFLPLEHYTMALDGATFGVVADALDNAGPGSPERASKTACNSLLVPNFNPIGFLVALPPIVLMPLITTVGAAKEPPLQSYAQ